MPDREDLNDEDRCPCCRSLGELPILACELCGAPPGCEACRCVDGDAWGGPSCCAAAMAAFEAIVEEGRTAFVRNVSRDLAELWELHGVAVLPEVPDA